VKRAANVILAVPGCTFLKFHFHLWRIRRFLITPQAGSLAAINAGERDAARLIHCNNVSGRRERPGPNRVAAEWPDKW
jgi:hypothetical protein